MMRFFKMKQCLSMPANPQRYAIAFLAGMALLVSLAASSGCQAVGAATYMVAGPTKTVTVPARYTGLDDQSVAVMIAGDEYMLYRYPRAQIMLATNISGRLVEHVPGVTVVNPQTVIQFQHENPEWLTLTYSELIERMDVDRLIIVDLAEYRTHDPGDKNLWRGKIVGNVGVIERDAIDPDNFSFYASEQAMFPEDGGIGVLNSDEQTVQLALTATFAQKTVEMFYEHEKEVPR